METFNSDELTLCLPFQNRVNVKSQHCLLCVVKPAPQKQQKAAMKRSNSWKSLQKTFASTPINPTKRAKFSRKNSSKSVDKSISKSSSIDATTIENSYQIEDSDEENVPTIESVQTPIQRSNYRRFAKPLNISINTNDTSNSIICNSDTDESLSGEPELIDVSECQVRQHHVKARSKSLLFLPNSAQNRSNSDNECDSSHTTAPIEQQKSKIRRTFDSATKDTSRLETDTTIESDSCDESKSPKTSVKVPTNKPKKNTSEILFTQSSEASNPIIESESTQFSVKFDSQSVHRVQRKKPKMKKCVKGGLVERLNKALNSTKSEYLFWLNERTSNLIEAGEKMRIDKIEYSYGRVLLHCSRANESTGTNAVNILCVDPTFKKLAALQIGKIIEVALDCHKYATNTVSHFYPQVSKILV